MDRKKTWVDVHEGEILSDNSQVEDCKQCQDCIFKDKRGHDRAVCMAYPNPGHKPVDIMEDKEECYFYEKDDE